MGAGFTGTHHVWRPPQSKLTAVLSVGQTRLNISWKSCSFAESGCDFRYWYHAPSLLSKQTNEGKKGGKKKVRGDLRTLSWAQCLLTHALSARTRWPVFYIRFNVFRAKRVSFSQPEPLPFSNLTLSPVLRKETKNKQAFIALRFRLEMGGRLSPEGLQEKKLYSFPQ